MQVRVVIFGMQVDNDVLYCGIANQPSHAYSSLYLSDFLSFHSLNGYILLLNNILWDCQPGFSSSSSQHLSNFLSFHTLNDEIFRQRFL